MVERAEIEAKVRELEAAVDQTKESLKNKAVLVALVVVAVVVVAYVLGKRRGEPRGAVVEVYEL
jgi:t-SNARE complex subunit (syntaxin)